MPTERRVRPRTPALLAAVAVAAAVVLVLAACAGEGGALVQGAAPVVTVTIHGGECATAPCDQTVYLEADGRVHAAAKPPNDLGHVPPAPMTALTAAIAATDFAAVRSHPFAGTCPTAVDGQELIFEFSTASGTQRISSCEVAIDWGSPLFVALGAALAQWVPLPAT